MKEKILIVEDQFIEANNLQMILERAGYHVCGIARSVPAALALVAAERPDMVLLDIYLQGPATGIDLAKKLRADNIAFVYLSANSSKDTLETAKATQPYGFLVKPFRENDVLVTLDIARYLHENSLEAKLRREPALQHQLRDVLSAGVANEINPTSVPVSEIRSFSGIIGDSPQLRQSLEHLSIVAPTDTSVLLLGESGTGKERFADCVHRFSARNKGPLVKVNCAALPSTLIESELFGHERGAFTGALEKRIGKFEQAEGGTIFLDEIGELSFEVQVKLLRVLQEKEIERLGGKHPVKLNVRFIAATNRNLEKEVAEGRFRMDLYYRLNVFPLQLPPLRDRQEDIPALAYYFIGVYSKQMKKKVVGLSDELMDKLLTYSWPGNIRELAHLVERSVLLAKGDIIKDMPLPVFNMALPSMPAHGGKIKTIEENERDHILSVLKVCKGKIFGKGGAAEMLGINVSTLNSKIKKLGIRKEMIYE